MLYSLVCKKVFKKIEADKYIQVTVKCEIQAMKMPVLTAALDKLETCLWKAEKQPVWTDLYRKKSHGCMEQSSVAALNLTISQTMSNHRCGKSSNFASYAIIESLNIISSPKSKKQKIAHTPSEYCVMVNQELDVIFHVKCETDFMN